MIWSGKSAQLGIGYLCPLQTLRLFLLLVLCPIPSQAQIPEREISPLAVTLTAQPDEDGRKVWHTDNFRIDLDIDLSADELKRIAQVVETTAWLVKHHPLPLYSPPSGRNRIAIYARDDAYVAAGAVGGTAGYYNAWMKCVLIRGSALIPSGDGRGRLLPRHDEGLVVHELVHLSMHGNIRRMPIWFIEGIAEFFASAHLGAGRFSFVNRDASIRDYLRGRLSPTNPMVPVSPIQEIVALNLITWQDYQRILPAEDRCRPYASALLLTHYYLHGGTERYEWLRNALARPRGTDLAAIETTGTEETLVRYWKPKGVTPVFSPAPPINP